MALETLAGPWRLHVDRSTRTSCSRSLPTSSVTVRKRLRRCVSLPAPGSGGTKMPRPKVLEPVWRHFGVSDRVLDVLVPEVVLQGPRVVAIVGELKPTGVAKHVRVDGKWHLGGLADALDESVKADGTHWSA